MVISLFFNITKSLTGAQILLVGVFDITSRSPLEQIRETTKMELVRVVQTTSQFQDVIVRLPASNNGLPLLNTSSMLQNVDKDIQIRSIEFVGLNVGEEVAQGAVYATCQQWCLFMWGRFEWRLGFWQYLLLRLVIITLEVFCITN